MLYMAMYVNLLSSVYQLFKNLIDIRVLFNQQNFCTKTQKYVFHVECNFVLSSVSCCSSLKQFIAPRMVMISRIGLLPERTVQQFHENLQHKTECVT